MSNVRTRRSGRFAGTVASGVAALVSGMLVMGPSMAAGTGAPATVRQVVAPAQVRALLPGRQPARSIKIKITGLPAGTAPRVTVRGPNGFRESLTASTVLARLASGRYRVTATPVALPDGSVATASLSAGLVRVTARTRARVVVTYAATTGPSPSPDPTTQTSTPTPVPTSTPEPTTSASASTPTPTVSPEATVSPSASPTPSTPTGWTGTWCQFGSDFGRIELVQDGSNVTGTFTGTDEVYHKRGRITATLNGTTITGRWDRDASVSNLPGQDAGTLTWTLGANQLSMSGSYTRDDYPNDPMNIGAERSYGSISCTGSPFDR